MKKMEADTLLDNKSKVEVAAAVRAACSNASEEEDGLLEQIVDRILTTPKSLSDVDDEETIEWCQWLIAGGSTPEEFSQTVRLYDKATTCGLVYTENFVAYRCRTCGISPYLSLCTDCFHKGNHEGHDFIVFRSETGGACDCGEINVIKESGCCVLHGPRGTAAMQRAEILAGRNSNNGSRGNNDPSTSSSSSIEQSAPPELLCIANGLMPRLFHRLIAYLRAVEARKLARAQQLNKNNMNKGNKGPRPKTSSPQPVSLAATAVAMMANPGVSAPPKGYKFLKLLQGFSDMGVAMRQVMTSALTDTSMYKSLCGIINPEYESVGMKIPEHHKTFLEELVYWTVKREFPEDLKRLLLSLRLDSSYNEAFARAFITHYELISESILKSSDPERLCKHIAAVSVELFSKEKLAIAMVEQMQLLHLLLRSLYHMIRSTAVPISSLPALLSSSSSASTSSLSEEVTLEKVEEGGNEICRENVSYNSSMINHNGGESTLKVIDCDNDIIKNNYYWLIKSDLKELLSHGPVATKFFNDSSLLSTWFDFLTLLQGMIVNKYVSKGEPHVEHESDSYVGAFMAELVISATLMCTLVSHLKDASSKDITLNFVRLCRMQLSEWFRHVQYPKGTVSFHLPLHRYLSTFIRQGLQFQGLRVEELLPPEVELDVIVRQILRLQTAYYGISTRLWARNGPSLVNQAEYYVSSLCCNSMVDADLFILQLAAVRESGLSSADKFLEMAIEEFGVTDINIEKCLSDESDSTDDGSMNGVISGGIEPEEQMTMLENFMIFLATVATARTNLGIADQDLMALEMSVLLCKSDKPHSELMDMLPERCGNDAQMKESVLAQIAEFQAPRNMQQGIFTPKPCIWEEVYDPIYTMLRSSNRADYQSSRDRYQDYVNRSKKGVNPKNLWPPFRLPSFKPTFVNDPGRILLSKKFLEVAVVILYHGVFTGIFSELVVSLCVFLLEVAVHAAEGEHELEEFVREISVPIRNSESLPNSRGESGRGESIVSLLLQLYTKLSGESRNYVLKSESEDVELTSSPIESRIGDGPFFVAKVLDKLSEKSGMCRLYILNEVGKYHLGRNTQAKQELSSEEKEREEKRRKAKERKLHLMNEYAMKRQQFMNDSQDQSGPTEGNDNAGELATEQNSSTLFERFHDHACVICMEKLESKPNNPFGLMTYLSPCNILGYQRLHVPEENGPFLKTIHKETLQDLLKHYEDSSVIQHIPLDPGFGVQVQSCGHLMHQDCFSSFMTYVKKAPPPPPSLTRPNKPAISFTYKEYSCPLCRQLGNSFLPMIFPSPISKDQNQTAGNFNEISKMIKKRNKCTLSNSEKTAEDRFIRDINACAMNNFQSDVVKILKDFDSESPLVSAFLLTLHLRQSVDRQLKLRESNGDGSAAGSSTPSSARLSSLLPLLSVIKHRYKTLPVGYARKLAQNWEMICGRRSSKGNGEVPTMLRDVETELFHFLLELPIMEASRNVGINIFNGVIQALYNLRVIQVLAAISSQFSDVECHEIVRVYSQSDSALEKVLCLILKNFLEIKGEPVTPANDDFMNADENGNHKNVEIPETLFIENLAQSLLIPFLKTAAYLKSEFFGQTNTMSIISSNNFSNLVEYLQLGPPPAVSNGDAQVILFTGRGSNNREKSCSDLLFWRRMEGDGVLDGEIVIENWCSELLQSISHSRNKDLSMASSIGKDHPALELLKSHLYIYDKPSLITLPTEYETIFENYRKIKCQKCELAVPTSPALCLICGEILCLNELCCFDLELKASEVVSHCQKKCGRIGLFLSIMTSEILIVKEKEACIWGSIFLDSFCEEDLELKRGKPLFLCQERLDILQRHWVAQSFYKSELKWFQHENFL